MSRRSYGWLLLLRQRFLLWLDLRRDDVGSIDLGLCVYVDDAIWNDVFSDAHLFDDLKVWYSVACFGWSTIVIVDHINLIVVSYSFVWSSFVRRTVGRTRVIFSFTLALKNLGWWRLLSFNNFGNLLHLDCGIWFISLLFFLWLLDFRFSKRSNKRKRWWDLFSFFLFYLRNNIFNLLFLNTIRLNYFNFNYVFEWFMDDFIICFWDTDAMIII